MRNIHEWNKKVKCINYSLLSFVIAIFNIKRLEIQIIKEMSIISVYFCWHKQQSKCLYEGKPNWNVINNPKFTEKYKLLKSEWPKLKSELNLVKPSKFNITCNPVSFRKLCTTFNWICNQHLQPHTNIQVLMQINTKLTLFAQLFLENSGGPVWAAWRREWMNVGCWRLNAGSGRFNAGCRRMIQGSAMPDTGGYSWREDSF